MSEALLTEIGKTDGVDSCEYDAVSSTLRVGFSKGSSRLIELLRMLNENNVSFIDLTVKKPSLNDVFLEITGKELRDSV
jgi:ABC-2 type transport system ATP-binding protein